MIPHAPGGTLAHLAACLAVAEGLRTRGHDPVFAYGGTRPELLDRAGFEWRGVVEAPGAMVTEWFGSADELDTMLGSQLALVDALGPAACVTSSGIGRLAAECRGLPEMTFAHGLAGSRYGRPAVRRWMIRDTARHPTRLVGHIHSRWVHSRPVPVSSAIAELRSRRGLPELSSPGNLIAAAEAVACTTAPFLDPTVDLPSHWHYVGPLDFGFGDGTTAPSRGSGPRAYVSQGSTGSARLLKRAVAALAGDGWEVIVNTGGLCEPEELRDLGPSVIAEEIGDARSELEAAELAVIAGGHLTSMQALIAGTPTVVVPRSGQQSAGALRAERLGTGVALWPPPRRGAIARAAAKVMRDRSYAERAALLSARLRAEWNGNARAAALAESLLGDKPA